MIIFMMDSRPITIKSGVRIISYFSKDVIISLVIQIICLIEGVFKMGRGKHNRSGTRYKVVPVFLAIRLCGN